MTTATVTGFINAGLPPIDTLARRALAYMEASGSDSVGPTDAVRMLDEYQRMTPEQREAVTERARLLCNAFSEPSPLSDADVGPYLIRNYKPFATPDGGGFNASLYCGKRKVADLHDGGYGGQMEFRFTTQADRESFSDYVSKLDSLAWWRDPVAGDGAGIGFVTGLLDRLDKQREVERMVRKMTTHVLLFRAPATLSTIPLKGRRFDSVQAQVAAKYPDAALLNALPQAEARALIGQWYEAQP